MDECVSESLEDKNTSLAQSLKAYERLRINYKGKAILPINAVTSDKKQRRQYMMELRRHISKSPSVEVTIKLRWFGFYLSLLSSSKAQQRAILSLQECLDIGRSLDMDEQETRKAITFFHNLNLILHYQTDELDMLVIINLKPILDLVSLTIGVSFINEDELHDLFPSTFLLVPEKISNSTAALTDRHWMNASNSLACSTLKHLSISLLR